MAVQRQQSTLVGSVLKQKEEERKKKKAQEAAKVNVAKQGESKTGGVAGGAATGAATGAVAGPVGALVGAGVGAAAGAAESNQAKKDAESAGPRSKRRKLQLGVNTFRDARSKREFALATLSQSVFDFAQNLR